MADRPAATGLRAGPIPDTLAEVILYAAGARIELTFRRAPEPMPPGLVVDAVAYVDLPDADEPQRLTNRQIFAGPDEPYLRLFVARMVIDIEDEVAARSGTIVEEPTP